MEREEKLETENLIFRFEGPYLTNSTTEKVLCCFGVCVLRQNQYPTVIGGGRDPRFRGLGLV